MTCHEIVDFLMDYLDGTLSWDSEELFELHLSHCPDCLAYLQTYESAIRLGRCACGCDNEPCAAPEELIRAVLLARAWKA